MKKWLKRAGIGLGSIALALVLGIAAIYAASEVRFRRAYDDVAVSPLRAATGPGALERGRHLAVAINKCVDCHGADLGGKVFLDAGMLGTVSATNLTTGRGGVGGQYSDGEIERAIRQGIGRDGHALAVMPSGAFQVMSDEDVQAVIAYVRSVPPVDRELPTTTVRALGRALYLAGKLPIYPAELIDHKAGRGVPVPAGVTLAYGEYLTTIGGCRDCHGRNLAGAAQGEGPGMPPAANLTPAGGLAKWSEQDFFTALRTGKRPDGTAIRAPMPWALSGQMTDDEIRAVWMYIKSVPAAPTPTA